jgi:hypothetical protein
MLPATCHSSFPTQFQTIIRDNFGLWGALALAAGLKAAILALDIVPFNADEAVVALMARHILQGERPVFFYGQAYLGSLDAWLIAGAFLIFGQTVLAIRIVQSALYLGTIATTYLLGLKIFGSRWIAGAAALLLALPTVTVTLYTTATLGGYGEMLLIGNTLLLWALRLGGLTSTTRVADTIRSHEWVLFGLLAGIGFWAFGFLGVYILPICMTLLWPKLNHEDAGELVRTEAKFFLVFLRALRAYAVNYFLAFVGFALGSSPWWFATLFGAATLTELGGSAIAGASAGGPLVEALRHAFYFVILGLPVIMGVRPSWAVQWLALPLFPLALVLFMGAVGRAIGLSLAGWRRAGWRANPTGAELGRALLLGLCATLILAFIVTPFGADPSGRYFLPLAIPLALFTADLLDRVRRDYPRLAIGLLGGLLAFNLWGHVDAASVFPPGFTTQFDPVAQVDQRDLPQVIEFLTAHGETRCYSNYWVTFPVAFLSSERIICAARLPYHLDFRYTSRDDRYPPYTQAVADADHVAYVTTRHPPLDERLRSGLAGLGVTFSETQIGDFHIFYNLSRKVIPDELGLGAK